MTARADEELVPPAVDTLPINLAVIDDDGTIRYTNRAWREFGLENDVDNRPDMIGVDYLDVASSAESETGQAAAEGIGDVVSGDSNDFELEYPCHGPDTRRWFRMRARPFSHEGDRYVVIAHTDITDRYEYERRLAESNERLEQFAYAASHDLQEPLRMVTSYLDLIERRYGDELDEDAREFIDFAVDGAKRMKGMIDGLLQYSRVETRGDELGPVDLDAVVDDVLTDLRPRIEESDAEITIESLPTVQGDARQLRQVFQNLLDNAIEYSGEAAPLVTITSRRTDGQWDVSVTDEGIGIAPDEQERIFRVFERLHSRAEHDGSGIGLAISRRIVERHGGELRVDSEPGEGATFSFTLPATDE